MLLDGIIKKIIPSSQLIPTPSTISLPVTDVPTIDPTYGHTLASWALWIIDRWVNDPHSGCERSEVIKDLLLNAGREDNRT